jgi:hypothetical protein
MLTNLMCLTTLSNYSMCLFLYMGFMEGHGVHGLHPDQLHAPLSASRLLFMLINLMGLMTLLNFSTCLSFYMWHMGVMVYMDCTLINLMHL